MQSIHVSTCIYVILILITQIITLLDDLRRKLNTVQLQPVFTR